jgi:molybdenum cofactor synthesis domain-containing protein
VHFDYHIKVDSHRYSVPRSLVGQVLEARLMKAAIELLRRGTGCQSCAIASTGNIHDGAGTYDGSTLGPPGMDAATTHSLGPKHRSGDGGGDPPTDARAQAQTQAGSGLQLRVADLRLPVSPCTRDSLPTTATRPRSRAMAVPLTCGSARIPPTCAALPTTNNNESATDHDDANQPAAIWETRDAKLAHNLPALRAYSRTEDFGNCYTVLGLLSRLGCQVIDMGVVRDDPALLEAAFTGAAAQADAIITSGGVSVGEADFTKTMMKKLGDVAFWRIAMRPGRPMAVGRILPVKSASSAMNTGASSYEKHSNQDGAVLFGLPGNPVAVMVTFLAFVRPALLQMMGANPEPVLLLKARSLEAILKKPGRTEYQRARVSAAPDGSLQVKTTGSQGSGVLRSMAEANGLMVLHHAQGNVAAGDEVDVMMFEGVS